MSTKYTNDAGMNQHPFLIDLAEGLKVNMAEMTGSIVVTLGKSKNSSATAK